MQKTSREREKRKNTAESSELSASQATVAGRASVPRIGRKDTVAGRASVPRIGRKGAVAGRASVPRIGRKDTVAGRASVPRIGREDTVAGRASVPRIGREDTVAGRASVPDIGRKDKAQGVKQWKRSVGTPRPDTNFRPSLTTILRKIALEKLRLATAATSHKASSKKKHSTGSKENLHQSDDYTSGNESPPLPNRFTSSNESSSVSDFITTGNEYPHTPDRFTRSNESPSGSDFIATGNESPPHGRKREEVSYDKRSRKHTVSQKKTTRHSPCSRHVNGDTERQHELINPALAGLDAADCPGQDPVPSQTASSVISEKSLRRKKKLAQPKGPTTHQEFPSQDQIKVSQTDGTPDHGPDISVPAIVSTPDASSSLESNVQDWDKRDLTTLSDNEKAAWIKYTILQSKLDAKTISDNVKNLLEEHKIYEATFGEEVLGLQPKSTCALLKDTREWKCMSKKHREGYARVYLWLKDPNNLREMRTWKSDCSTHDPISLNDFNTIRTIAEHVLNPAKIAQNIKDSLDHYGIAHVKFGWTVLNVSPALIGLLLNITGDWVSLSALIRQRYAVMKMWLDTPLNVKEMQSWKSKRNPDYATWISDFVRSYESHANASSLALDDTLHADQLQTAPLSEVESSSPDKGGQFSIDNPAQYRVQKSDARSSPEKQSVAKMSEPLHSYLSEKSDFVRPCEVEPKDSNFARDDTSQVDQLQMVPSSEVESSVSGQGGQFSIDDPAQHRVQKGDVRPSPEKQSVAKMSEPLHSSSSEKSDFVRSCEVEPKDSNFARDCTSQVDQLQTVPSSEVESSVSGRGGQFAVDVPVLHHVQESDPTPLSEDHSVSNLRGLQHSGPDYGTSTSDGDAGRSSENLNISGYSSSLPPSFIAYPPSLQPSFIAYRPTLQPSFIAYRPTLQPSFIAYPSSLQPSFNAHPLSLRPSFDVHHLSLQPSFDVHPPSLQPSFNGYPRQLHPSFNFHPQPLQIGFNAHPPSSPWQYYPGGYHAILDNSGFATPQIGPPVMAPPALSTPAHDMAGVQFFTADVQPSGYILSTTPMHFQAPVYPADSVVFTPAPNWSMNQGQVGYICSDFNLHPQTEPGIVLGENSFWYPTEDDIENISNNNHY